MAEWTTNAISVDPEDVIGYGNRFIEHWRNDAGFDGEIPEACYVLRIFGTITASLDAASGSPCDIKAGILGPDDAVVGRLSPGQSGTFPFDTSPDPAVGPLGQWDLVFSVMVSPDGGVSSAVDASLSDMQVTYVLSDTLPDPDPEPEPEPEPSTGYNCACDDGQPTVTLQQMRNRLARRLGFSVQVTMGALPPGMPELLDDFIRSTHELMYQRYSVMRLRRMFTWDMVAGQRFYDIDGNRDDCPRILNPDKLEWVGISQGDSSWRPLVCGINPVLYGSAATGIPSHYEIRQCIEVWPAPTDDAWQLRIKGDFGPTTLEADDDVLTVDPEAVFLQALANAKAHYGMADAANYASQATAYVRSRVAGSHQTRRYIPGSCVQPPAVRPLLKED